MKSLLQIKKLSYLMLNYMERNRKKKKKTSLAPTKLALPLLETHA